MMHPKMAARIAGIVREIKKKHGTEAAGKWWKERMETRVTREEFEQVLEHLRRSK